MTGKIPKLEGIPRLEINQKPKFQVVSMDLPFKISNNPKQDQVLKTTSNHKQYPSIDKIFNPAVEA